MAKQNDRQRADARTEKTTATEEPAHVEERQRVIEEYIADLREVLRKLRRLFN
jgi:hypothetical protein